MWLLDIYDVFYGRTLFARAFADVKVQRKYSRAVSMDSENVTPKGEKWDRENVIPVSFSFMRFLRHK